jgi:flavin-dependent dehydrogenase
MNVPRPITIVGGGLAGLSLGIALRRAGVDTRIIEAGHYPRHRVCGEFITGLDDATIETLGIAPAFAGAGSLRHVTFFRRGRAIGRHALPSPARAISRYTLDARLAGLFTAASGRLATDQRQGVENLEQGWVQTTGRKRRDDSPWIGLKLHARNLTRSDELELHLGDGAYVGLSAVEDGWVNVCGLFHRRPGLRFDREAALSSWLCASGLGELAKRLEAAEIRPGSRSAVAGFGFDHRLPASDGVRLGDASVMIPPFTGNGMAMAFLGAALALGPLVAWARGGPSWPETTDAIRRSLQRAFTRRLACAAGLHPFLLKPAGQYCLGTAGRAGLLPVGAIYRLLH